MEGITWYDINEKFWNVQFLKKNFDSKSRTIIKDYTKKTNRKGWAVSRSYAKEAFPTIEGLQAEVLKTLSESGIAIRVRGEHGSYDLGTVTQNKDSSFRFSLCENIDRRTFSEKKAEPAKVEKPVEKAENDETPPVVFDPNSNDAKALLGMSVEISNQFNFSAKRVITLDAIDPTQTMPFWGRTEDGKQVSGVFIRKYIRRIVPLDLNDPSVRALLRERWIINKVNGQETMITNFRKENGRFLCNGLDAHALLSAWTFDDGTPVGLEK